MYSINTIFGLLMSKERLKRKETINMFYLSLSFYHPSPHLLLSHELKMLIFSFFAPPWTPMYAGEFFVHGARQMLCTNALAQNCRHLQRSFLCYSCTGSTVPLGSNYKIQSTILRISRWWQHSIKPSVGCFLSAGPWATRCVAKPWRKSWVWTGSRYWEKKMHQQI